MSQEFKATGKWEVGSRYDPNYEARRNLVIDPNGKVWADFEPGADGYFVAVAYAETFNLNEDKSDDFVFCPYCKTGCSWCC